MVITYTVKNSLYVNMTNHCTNRCAFCVRDRFRANSSESPFPNLWLEREPTVAEVLADLSSYKSLNRFEEIVFCGFGEPTCRLYDMLEVCRRLREATSTPIRVDTNGHASLILKENTAPLFQGLVDRVSISLNAADPETYAALSEHPNIAGVKEASGNISAIAKICAECGDLIDVYSGNDDQIVPIMALGGKGVISVMSNVAPAQTHAIAQCCLDNNFPEAASLAAKYLPLANALFCDVNPIPVKEALNMMGIAAGPCRLPLYEMEDSKKTLLRNELVRAGLIK